MRLSARTELPQLLLIAAMFVVAALTWPVAPERIPVHWGLSGEADGYAGRFWGLFGQPLIATGLYVLFLVLPRVDPLGTNYARFRNPYLIVRYLIVLFIGVIYGLVVLWARGVDLEFSVVLPVAIGLLFVVVGNLLGKIRPNWFVGIRTPWTLTSKRSWTKTHRLGGWLFVFLGLTFLVGGLVRPSLFASLAGIGVAACALLLFVYSYLAWRKDPDARPLGTRREGNRRG